MKKPSTLQLVSGVCANVRFESKKVRSKSDGGSRAQVLWGGWLRERCKILCLNVQQSLYVSMKLFEKLNRSYLSSNRKPRLSLFVVSLALKKNKQLTFYCSVLFVSWGENFNNVSQNWGTSENFEKIEILPKTVILFSAVWEEFRAVHRFSALKQTWNYSESNLMSVEWLWDVNLGCRFITVKSIQTEIMQQSEEKSVF